MLMVVTKMIEALINDLRFMGLNFHLLIVSRTHLAVYRNKRAIQVGQ